MRKLIPAAALLSIGAFLTVGCSAKTSPPPRRLLYVDSSQLNLRACPDSNCEVISTLKRGQVLTPLQDKLGWVEVSTEQNLRGWVDPGFLVNSEGQRLKQPSRRKPPKPPAEEWAPSEKPAAESLPAVEEEFAR